ncbi:MAG: DUF177 domain-containing protein [Deltaproteobacteria bacterium]|nr:MAG: DUF177 domain-containing protein [Deltaproteobacteria bacterium]
MEIRVESLKVRPLRLVFDEPVDGFPMLCELQEQGEVVFRSAVSAELVAALAGSLVEVEGRLACVVVTPCSRCLQPVEQKIDLQVTLSFSRQSPLQPSSGGDVELTEDEVGLIPFDGDVIDLRPALEQELLMALPQHPLCAEECAGLCPVCGADLNRDPCQCVRPVFHGGLAALRNFRVEKD